MTRTSNSEPSFDSIQMKLFCALVRARNNMETIRRSLTLRLRSRRAKELDSIAFNKFKVLIPELAEYNRAGTFKRLRSRAFLNGFHNLDGYYNSLLTDEKELSYLRKNLTYIGSHFFRGSVWQRLGEICRDQFATSGEETIRVWSAACSNGKEVYSILATLLDFLPAEKLDILATDYNDFALGQCLEGCYSMRTMDEIPKKYWRYIKTFKAPEPRKVDFSYRYQFRFCDDLRRLIHGRTLNLLSDEYPTGFDLILCRNVIKFFTPDKRIETQHKLAQSLKPDGLLVLSEEEIVANPELMGLMRIDDTCIYRKRV